MNPPGFLNYDLACPKGHPVSIDAQGRILCYQCGGLVTKTIPMEQAKHIKETAVQIPLMKPGRAE